MLPTLSQPTGGLDPSDPYAQASRASGSDEPAKPRKGMARVVRDADGRVVDLVEYESEDVLEMTPWGQQLNASDDDHEDEVEPDQALLPPRVNEGHDNETVHGVYLGC